MKMTNDIDQALKAENSPWYLLATLFGQPVYVDDNDLRIRNRRAWNRYMSRWLNKDTLALVKEKLGEEFEPFSNQELSDLVQHFHERHRQAKAIVPELKENERDFFVEHSSNANQAAKRTYSFQTYN